MPLKFKSLVDSAIWSWKNHQLHSSAVTEATGALKGIERDRGPTNSRDLKLCDDYAVEVLGHKRFAPWLYVYAAISGKFREGWIPDNYYGSVVLPKIQRLFGAVSNLRPLNALIFQSDAFPDLLSYANGIFFDTVYRLVTPEAVKDTLFKDRMRVVYKLNRSMRGQGVHVFDRNSFNVEKVQRLGNGLFQSFIEQHSVFSKFAKGSVATVRITTVYEETGEVSVRASNLRLGSGADTHVQSRSQILIPIDLRSGAFSPVGYTPEWRETRVHPTSQVEFSGNVIPAFQECIRTVTGLHMKVPYVRCIGWDAAVDQEEKVRIMEWNGDYPGIKFNEATQGPCFADLGWERLSKHYP